MGFVQRLPGLSLGLLLLTYTSFGWYWAAEAKYLQESWLFRMIPQSYWVLLILSVIVLAAFMTEPFQYIRTLLQSLFDSSNKPFLRVFATSVTLVIIGSTIGVLLLMRSSLVTNTLLLICALSLARLDLQNSDFGEWQAFWILLFVASCGLAFGSSLHWALPNWLDRTA